MAVAKSLDKV